MAPPVQIASQLRPAVPAGDRFPALVPALPQAGVRVSPAGRARIRLRHALLICAFLLLVPGPVGLTAWYLTSRAQPQYASTFGFVVHSEGDGSTSGLLSVLPAVGALGGSSSTDTDVLARFLMSQALVEEVDARLDLRARWSGGFAADPVFAFDATGTVEDLTRYWQRMISVDYDYSAGTMEVEVRSFDASSALAIARAVEGASSRLINRLSGVARADRLNHAGRELARAEVRLSEAREALMVFRARHHLVDPMTELAGDLAVVSQLQAELADESVAMGLLRRTLAGQRPGLREDEVEDRRLRLGEDRMQVIRDRIAMERAKVGGANGGKDYPRLMGEFERLAVAVEVAQQAYVLALAAQDAARAEADRKSRYVATYAPAHLPERAIYPRTAQILAMVAAGALLIWATVMLIYSSLRDRF